MNAGHPRPLKSVRENWVVPPGLALFLPLFPALKALGKGGPPLRGLVLGLPFHGLLEKRVLTPKLLLRLANFQV